MHIEKSFQLLSADNSKLAADETSFQSAGDIDAEFGDLLSVELESQEQQNSAGNDKKSGQEVAALLIQQTKVASEHVEEGAPVAQALLEHTAAATDPVPAKQASTTQSDSEVAALSQTDAADFVTEQTTDTNPWLTIIHQSNDFNAILSQNPQTTPGESPLTAAEVLAAEVLGVPTPGQAATAAESNTTKTSTITDSTHETAGADEPQLTTLTAAATAVGSSVESVKVPADATSSTIVEQQHSDSALSAAPILPTPAQAASSADSSAASRVIQAKAHKMPAEQMEVLELVKTDKPHQLNQGVVIDEQPTVTAEQDNPKTSVQTTAVAQSDLTDEETVTSHAAVASATRNPAPLRSQITEAILNPLNQTDSKGEKLSPTNPGDLELPIDMSPGIQAFNATLATPITPATAGIAAALVPGASATTVGAAKNSSPSFAQFQKAVNAAASLVQKQQAEQTQNLPSSEQIAQQPAKFAELSVVMSGQHTDTPASLNTLLQTERPISAGGSAMGSSTGQQQQQAASQLFATRLNEQVTSNTQPALSLLEPTAATQLKERVMFQVNQKIQSAEIKLAPEELGSMQIKVQMQQEQLSVQFVVQQAGAKEALEQQMPRLRDMLEEQGIELTQGQVSQQREGSAEQRQTRERRQGVEQGPDIGDEPLQQQVMVRVSDRMVDYYA